MELAEVLQTTPWLLTACVLIVSLLVGSFLNVVIHRLPKIIAVQSEASAPLAKAFRENLASVPAIEKKDTLAEGIAIAEPVPVVSTVFEDMSAPVEAQEFAPLVHKQADNVTETLDGWLENIRRIKACR